MTLSFHERALQAGLGLARSVAGVSITITRNATTITVSNAIQGVTEKAPLGEEGEITVDAADWLIPAAAYTLGTPADGDIIVRNVNGTAYTYTVETPQYGTQCWDWSDTGKTQYRVHSRKDGGTAFDVSRPNGFDLSGTELRYG